MALTRTLIRTQNRTRTLTQTLTRTLTRCNAPNGYTEESLTRWRRARKEVDAASLRADVEASRPNLADPDPNPNPSPSPNPNPNPEPEPEP